MTNEPSGEGADWTASLLPKDPELVLGLVGAVGTDLKLLTTRLEQELPQFRCIPKPIRLSDLIREIGEKALRELNIKLFDEPEDKRIESFMDGGNALREKSGRDDYLALQAVSKINRRHGEPPKPLPRAVHVLDSLKRPEEVALLRKVYGRGFFLIAAYMPEDERERALIKKIKKRGIKAEERARHLMRRDQAEDHKHGQRTRDTFHLADVFLDLSASDWEDQLGRFLDLVFGHPYLTPKKDEHAMFLAYAASLRSASLSRQVGAVIATQDGEVLATGANDVPAPGGGLYWADGPDVRDHVVGHDSNKRFLNRMILEIMKARTPAPPKEPTERPEATDETLLKEGRDLLAKTGLLDITEFGRAVHAEMEALLACARLSVSPLDATLFTTTFPCHNCARHVIAAGIRRVVYIEPYPKSKAPDLHSDALRIEGVGGNKNQVCDSDQERVGCDDENHGVDQDRRVAFEPFVGIGPRRYTDLFSLNLPTGDTVKRREGDTTISWSRSTAELRVAMAPTSYLEREGIVSSHLGDLGEDAPARGRSDTVDSWPEESS